MPGCFYRRDRIVTVFWEGKFFLPKFCTQKKAFKVQYLTQASAMLTECNVILFTLILAICNLSLPVLVN